MRISGKFVPLLGAAGLTVAAALLTVTPASALDNGLALTPPMGFNNWNSTRCKADFNESMVKSIADISRVRGRRRSPPCRRACRRPGTGT